MMVWEIASGDYVFLKPWTVIGLRWATKYYIRMDDTEAYILSMCKFIYWLIVQHSD